MKGNSLPASVTLKTTWSHFRGGREDNGSALTLVSSTHYRRVGNGGPLPWVWEDGDHSEKTCSMPEPS